MESLTEASGKYSSMVRIPKLVELRCRSLGALGRDIFCWSAEFHSSNGIEKFTWIHSERTSYFYFETLTSLLREAKIRVERLTSLMIAEKMFAGLLHCSRLC